MFSQDKRSNLVLVVDDDQAVGAVIKAILVAGGYDVIMAPDGVEAWHIVQELSGTIGFVITDVMMPNMDGLELAQRLKTTHPYLPVLLVSAFSSRGIEEHLGERVKFLEKPFALHALLDAVRSGLNGGWFPLTHAASAA